MQTSTYTAPAISCEHCQRAIEQAVGVLPGVEEVQVEIQSKRVVVRFDPAQVSRQQIEAALDEEGYPVER
ncbi:MAG TPA: heavy-metal-associated domain-containing protein [Chloroflexota bacterium]|jgi:copper ion binding protein|nr:heavy-metal-associated domain-containing protein [Chloroflexota bacterium]